MSLKAGIESFSFKEYSFHLVESLLLLKGYSLRILFITVLTGFYLLFFLHVVSEWVAALHWSAWFTYSVMLISALLPLLALKFVPQKEGAGSMVNAYGGFVSLGFCMILINHWADRSLAYQLRYKMVSAETFLSSQNQWQLSYLKPDSILFESRIELIRYNLDDDKKYTGEFLLPFINVQNRNCLVWVYEQNHYGKKRKNELINDIKQTLLIDTPIALEVCTEPPLSWLSFEEARKISADLGFTESIVVKRLVSVIDPGGLIKLKQMVLFLYAGGMALLIFWISLKLKALKV